MTAPIVRCVAGPIDRAVNQGGQSGRSNRAEKSTLLRLLAGLDHTLHQTPSASLQFYQDQLDYDPDIADVLAGIRATYPDNVPGV